MRSPADADARLLRSFAPHDFASSLAYVIGFRDWAYRQRAVDLLGLAQGDRVERRFRVRLPYLAVGEKQAVGARPAP